MRTSPMVVRFNPANANAIPSLTPRTLNELLRIPSQGLARVDIARMNLLCATGLPDTANVDVEALLKQLDAWATVIDAKTKTLRHLLVTHKDIFRGSEPLWRMYCISCLLRHEFGVHYCEDERDSTKDADWHISSRHLIHGLLGPERHGTCASMPVLMVAIARRLRYPAFLVHSPGHVFCRWDGLRHTRPLWQQKHNIEFTGGFDALADEDYLHRPVKWTAETIREERLRKRPLFLRSLDPQEELASFLAQRGHAIEALGQLEEARSTYGIAYQFAPDNPLYALCARQCHKKQIDKALSKFCLTADEYAGMIKLRNRGVGFLFPWEGVVGMPQLEHLPHHFSPESVRVLRLFEFAIKDQLRQMGGLPLPPNWLSALDRDLLQKCRPVLPISNGTIGHQMPP